MGEGQGEGQGPSSGRASTLCSGGWKELNKRRPQASGHLAIVPFQIISETATWKKLLQ